MNVYKQCSVIQQNVTLSENVVEKLALGKFMQNIKAIGIIKLKNLPKPQVTTQQYRADPQHTADACPL